MMHHARYATAKRNPLTLLRLDGCIRCPSGLVPRYLGSWWTVSIGPMAVARSLALHFAWTLHPESPWQESSFFPVTVSILTHPAIRLHAARACRRPSGAKRGRQAPRFAGKVTGDPGEEVCHKICRDSGIGGEEGGREGVGGFTEGWGGFEGFVGGGAGGEEQERAEGQEAGDHRS